MTYQPYNSIKCLIGILYIFLTSVDLAYSAVSSNIFSIDVTLSSLSFNENGVVTSGPYPIFGKFRMTTGVNLRDVSSVANMELAQMDIQTSRLPKEPFGFPSSQGMYEGPTFTSDGDPCAYWFGPGTCHSQGVFDYCSGNFDGTTVTINGIQRIDGWFSYYDYKIVATVIRKGAAEVHDQLVKLNEATTELLNAYKSQGLSGDEALTAILNLHRIKNEALELFPAIFGHEFSRLYFGLRALDRWMNAAASSTFAPVGPPVLSSPGLQTLDALREAGWETYCLRNMLASGQDENATTALDQLDEMQRLLDKTTGDLARGAKNPNLARRTVDRLQQIKARALKSFPAALGLPFSDWYHLFNTIEDFLDAAVAAQNSVTFSGGDPARASALLQHAKSWGEAMEGYLSTLR